MRLLTPPKEFIQKFPPSPYVDRARWIAQNILEGKEDRIAVLMGPCSIHDPLSALEIARRIKKLSLKVETTLFLMMRFFIEKPRSQLGWKGIAYDPCMDGSNKIEEGLYLSRKLLAEIGEMGLGCCMEFLDPLVSFYVSDLISWGVIGARTSSSQIHRQLASSLPFPVGFKNDIYGNIETAVLGAFAAKSPHSYLGVDPQGRIASITSEGNPWTHLILRGAEERSNYDPASIAQGLEQLKSHSLPPRIMIDCSHGNSQKKAELQKISFQSVIDQIAGGNRAIRGLMLESHLLSGQQSLTKEPSGLHYGISITDACLGWEETEELILWADRQLSTSIKAE